MRIRERMAMMVYSCLLAAALVVSSPWWLWRMVTIKTYRRGARNRIGSIPTSLRRAVSVHDVIWLHAVSVGEIAAAEPLIREMQTALPTWLIAVSTTTPAGFDLANARLENCPVFFMPLDFAFVVRRYLGVIQPKLLILMESEIWPRLLVECEAAQVPVVVANARISDRSFPRYSRLRWLWRPLLNKVALFLTQGKETADRIAALGVESAKIRIVGNMKFDAPAPDSSEIVEALRRNLPPGDFVVCGSTLEGEEVEILDSWVRLSESGHRGVLMIAPRHPQRFSHVLEMVGPSGIQATEWLRGPRPLDLGDIIVLDTIGRLASIYQLATVALIGGSLVPAGGHNPLEPARFGVPIIMGPSYENFRDIVEEMRAARTITIVEHGNLMITLHRAMGRYANGETEIADRARAFFAAEKRGCSTYAGYSARASATKRETLIARRPWLLPLVPLYAVASAIKDWLFDRRFLTISRLTLPVISVGSLSAGGAGKTPFVIMLGEFLRQQSLNVDVLSRGYGREGDAQLQVDPSGSAKRYGDEPIEIARSGLPVFVGRRRHAAGQLAEASVQTQGHLLDDGFQHRRLERTLDIVLLTREDMEDTLLPAGNLREPRSALKRADVVILREDEASLLLEQLSLDSEVQVWIVRRELHLEDFLARPFVFCGLARPAAFVGMIESLGVEVAGSHFFRDHHPFADSDIDELIMQARSVAADGFYITAKDAVKLTPAWIERLLVVGPVHTGTLRLSLVDPEMALHRLRGVFHLG